MHNFVRSTEKEHPIIQDVIVDERKRSIGDMVSEIP